MTCNEQETTWNDLQQAVNDLKWATANETQPTTISTYQQRAKEELEKQQQGDFEIILQ